MKKINRSTDQLTKIFEQRIAVNETRHCLGCSHEGMLVTSRDGTIIEATPTAEHILNTRSSALKGQPIRNFCASPDMYDEIQRQTIHDSGF